MSIDLQGLLILLLFVAPGFLYSRAYFAARPRYQRAPDIFQQTVLAVVGSTLIHAGLIAILAIVIFIISILTNHNPAVNELLPATFDITSIRMLTIYSLIVALYITTSLIVAGRTGAWLGRLLPERPPLLYRIFGGSYPPEPILLWYTTLVEEPLRLGIRSPVVVAWLRSGERFEGSLVEFRLSADKNNVIELALENVIYSNSKSIGSTLSQNHLNKQTPLPQYRVLLNSDDILWLARVDIPKTLKET